MKGAFVFRSHQSHTIVKNGKRVTRRNNVNVSGSKGSKEVEVVQSGKTRRAKKALTKREITNIRKGVFMPRLFRGI